MKAGIWGTGGVAATHAQSLALAGVTLAAVVDRDAAKAAAFGQRWNAERAGTDPALLWDGEIDAVHICTPPALHFEMALEALEHGKHVLCEKPLCLTGREAAKLAAVAKAKGLHTAVNFNVRYHMACRRGAELVKSADFGPVQLIHGSYLQEFHAFPAHCDWRYNEKLAGPMRAVTEIGSHWIDLAQYISGRQVRRVSARFLCHNPTRYVREGLMYPEDGPGRTPLHVTSEDSVLLTAEFDGGLLANAVFCEVAHGRANRLSMEVVGQSRSLWWNSEEIGVLHSAAKGQGVNSELFAFGDNGFADSFRLLIEAFYTQLRGVREGSILPDFAQGAQIAQICDAIFASAGQDGAWVGV